MRRRLRGCATQATRLRTEQRRNPPFDCPPYEAGTRPSAFARFDSPFPGLKLISSVDEPPLKECQHPRTNDPLTKQPEAVDIGVGGKDFKALLLGTVISLQHAAHS